jgi:hypothetical protein
VCETTSRYLGTVGGRLGYSLDHLLLFMKVGVA